MEHEPETPPENADDWSNEQWIDWLKATDEAEPTHPPTPATTSGRVVHSSGGRVLGASMIGLAQALYGKQVERPAIVIEAGEPEGDPLELHLDLEHPERSHVVLRRDTQSTE